MLQTFDPWRSWAVATDVALITQAPASGWRSRRESRWRALVDAARRSPFYRERLAGHDPARVRPQDLAPVDKAELMGRFDAWVTDPALALPALQRFVAEPANLGRPFADRFVVWQSSGSSGQPGLFVQDAAAMAAYDALEALRRPLPNPRRRALDPWYLGERIAFVGATGGHFASVVANERLRRLNPLWSAVLRDVSFLQPLPALTAAIDAFAPTIIGTYPTAARLLAQEHAAGRLATHPLEVWTGGETLTPAMRRAIRHDFHCTVVDSYGASEFFTLACECALGHLHLNADWAILEPIDERGRPVPDGEPGADVLLTNLANHVQPLIRYRLGDRVTLVPSPCRCGSSLPVIRVQGRSDEMLELAGHGHRVRLLPLAVTTLLEDEAGLFDFELAQTGPAALRLRTPGRGREAVAALARGRDELAAFIAVQGLSEVTITTEAGRPRPAGPSGKQRRILRLRH